jgi:hypothetical protein
MSHNKRTQSAESRRQPYCTAPLLVRVETYNLINRHAESCGESVDSLINRWLDEEMATS